MKTVLRKWIGSTIALVTLTGAIATSCPVYAEQRNLGQDINPAVPSIDKTGLLVLIRQTLTALDLSNKSGNYTILREISAPGFSATNDSIKLSNLFRRQRETGMDYSQTLVQEPRIEIVPEITKQGYLHFGGYFPSSSSKIKFEMLFAAVNGRWRLYGISVDRIPVTNHADLGPAPSRLKTVSVMSDTAISPVRQGFVPVKLSKVMN